MIEALLSNPFLVMALLGGLIASITGGIIGSFIVIKRIVFITGSISHSVLGGIGLSLWLQRTYGIAWLSPMEGAIGAALLSAMIIGWIHLHHQEREDTVIAALWAAGMSLGVICISKTPGYNAELMQYLFGNILWITKKDLLILGGLDFLVILVVFLFRHQFLAICFDEKQAKLQKVPTTFFYLLLLCLIALSVVLLIQIVGAILVVAMLAIPAAMASHLTYRFAKMILIAIILSSIFTSGGIAFSYYLNWPPGATIAFVTALSYLLSFRYIKKIS